MDTQNIAALGTHLTRHHTIASMAADWASRASMWLWCCSHTRHSTLHATPSCCCYRRLHVQAIPIELVYFDKQALPRASSDNEVVCSLNSTSCRHPKEWLSTDNMSLSYQNHYRMRSTRLRVVGTRSTHGRHGSDSCWQSLPLTIQSKHSKVWRWWEEVVEGRGGWPMASHLIERYGGLPPSLASEEQQGRQLERVPIVEAFGNN